METKKKVSLFSKAMKDKKVEIDASKGFPEVTSFTPDQDLINANQVKKKNDSDDEEENDLFADITPEDLEQIENSNTQTIEEMTEEQIRVLQDFYTRELGAGIIKKLQNVKKSAPEEKKILENHPVLMNKLVDDFSVSALKDTIFKEQAIEKRDIDTFFERIYYDNYGDYEIYDEKTFEDLKLQETQFNSFDQLVKGLTGNQGTQALYTKVLQKLIMIMHIWEQKVNGDFVEMQAGDKKIKVHLTEINKRVLWDDGIIEDIIDSNEIHGWINPSLFIPSLELTLLCLNFNYSREYQVIQTLWEDVNFFRVYEKIIGENSLIEDMLKQNAIERYSKLLKKTEITPDMYNMLLGIVEIFICFSKNKSSLTIFGFYKNVIQDSIKSLANANSNNSSLFESLLRIHLMLLEKDTSNEIRKDLQDNFDLLMESITDKPEFLNNTLLLKIKGILTDGQAKNLQEYLVNLKQPEKIIEEILSQKGSASASDEISRITHFIKLCTELFNSEQSFQTRFKEQYSKLKEILGKKIFDSLWPKNINILTIQKDYYENESSLLTRNLLTKNLLIIDNRYSYLIESIAKFLSQFNTNQKNLDGIKTELEEITKWAWQTLDNYLSVLLSRIDLWYLSNHEAERGKNINYRKLKSFPYELTEPLLSALSALLISYLEVNPEGGLIHIIKILSVIEHLKWGKNISLSAYEKIKNVLQAQDKPIISPLFTVPKGEKINKQYHPNKTKYYLDVIEIFYNLVEAYGIKFLHCLPINKIFLRIAKNIFADQEAIYLDQSIHKKLEKIVHSILPNISLDLLGYYGQNNSGKIDKVIDQYSFTSYGDRLYTQVIFLFASNTFPDDLKKSVWNCVSMYSNIFYEALEEKCITAMLKEFLARKRPNIELREQLNELKGSLENDFNLEKSTEGSFLYKIIMSYLSFK